LGPHRRSRRREKKDKDIGYLKGNLNSQFQQIRQCLGMTVGNIGPKNDHMERSDLAKRFFIAG
jgi:hypothetical protein